MTVSIIIAVKAYCANLKECVNKCRELNFKDYEIIILSDFKFSLGDLGSSDNTSNVRIVPTGSITPPYKRDIGAKHAKGEILAFLDDDAYPVKEWLNEAVRIFNESSDIGCVCGPAITPESDSLRQKGSGLVYSSAFVSGNHVFRYIPRKRREVFDFPSCNFLIRKKLFDEVGGFDKPFWPGEDTFLCIQVIKAKKKMIYGPKVLVFHHRRNLFVGHLRQIKSYAFHRGYFVKKYPKTSFQLEYFIPSLFVLGVILGAYLSSFSPLIKGIYSSVIGIYSVSILLSSLILCLKAKESLKAKILLLFLVISGIILTHLVYGLYFIKGLFARKMPEENEDNHMFSSSKFK